MDYSKNPCPCRNHIGLIPNEAIVGDQAMNHDVTGRVVPGAPAFAELEFMQFLNGYGFLLLSHDP